MKYLKRIASFLLRTILYSSIVAIPIGLILTVWGITFGLRTFVTGGIVYIFTQIVIDSFDDILNDI